MLTPDIIRSEVVASGEGSALALEPEERRVPVTLVWAAARDADFGIVEWRTCIGDHLKVRVFDEIYVYSTYAEELMSQSRMVRKLRFLPFSAISGIERRLRMKTIRYRSALPDSLRRRSRKT